MSRTGILLAVAGVLMVFALASLSPAPDTVAPSSPEKVVIAAVASPPRPAQRPPPIVALPDRRDTERCEVGSGAIERTVFAEPISLFGGAGAMLAIDSEDNLYIAENYTSTGSRVTRVAPTGIRSTAVTDGVIGNVTGLACDTAGSVFIADGDGNGISNRPGTNHVWRLRPGETSPVLFASVANPTGIAIDSADDVYVASFTDRAIYRFHSSGAPVGRVGPVLTDRPYGIAVDSSGSVFVAGFGANSGKSGGTNTYRIDTSGVLSTFASPSLIDAYALAFDATGTLWASYYNSLKLLRVPAGSRYEVFPGGWTADDAPNGIAFDSRGALYVAVNGGRTTATAAVIKIAGAAPPACSVRRY